MSEAAKSRTEVIENLETIRLEPGRGAVLRRRRPSGEPPPLPHPIQVTGKILLGQLILVFVFLFVAGSVENLGSLLDRWESNLLHDIASIRTSILTSIAKTVDAVLSGWGVTILRVGTLLALIALKRFRHLFVFLGAILAVGWITSLISGTFMRPRAVGVEILGHWQGSSLPSRPAAALGVTLLGITYCLVVPGRPRAIAKRFTQLLMLIFAFTRLYLGVDHPIDLVMGSIIGLSIPVLAFRLLTPNEAFPVKYRRGRSAHLDITDERADAIRHAAQDQLGVDVIEIKPFGLAGSGGSTPLRLKTESKGIVFAKLYAVNHLRADRWYKLGRTLLYGRLEDEASFSSVRRLVQYEDYMLRVMRDAGLPTPEPCGFVEITPEREYLIITEFFDGASELLDEPELDDVFVDDALSVVRKMWDAGIAHRDVKPSNLLVRDNKLLLIDVAFGQVRPSPWRQAVDLANMMLVLALRWGPDFVYERALRFFSPEEIAEAFAATHSMTMPSQSRSLLRKNRGTFMTRILSWRTEREDLLARFRELAPKRRRISIQRWSLRRFALSVGVIASVIAMFLLALSNLRGAGLLGPTRSEVAFSPLSRAPECDRYTGDQLILQVQSVPTASLLPCLEALPIGWSFAGLGVSDGSSEIFLNSDRAGVKAVRIVLTPSCDFSGATQVPTDEPGTRRYERVRLSATGYQGSRYYVFEGGCVTYRFDLEGRGRTGLTEEVSLAVGFRTREGIASRFQRETGLEL